MTFWESVKAFLRREASDVRDGFEDLKDRFDAELTKRETELEATPSERLDMIRDDIEQGDSVFDRIEDKIDARLGESDADEEIRDTIEAAAEEPDAEDGSAQ